MKKILIIICFLLLAFPVFAQDSKETLALKRDLAQERIMRIRVELELMKAQFKEGQQVLKMTQDDLERLNGLIKQTEDKEKKK